MNTRSLIFAGSLLVTACGNDVETSSGADGDVDLESMPGAARAGYSIGFAARFGQYTQSYVPGLARAPGGALRVAGEFYGPAPFGGQQVETPSSAGYLFMTELGPDGALAPVRRLGGPQRDALAALVSGPDGSTTMVGEARGKADFGAGAVEGGTGLFVARYGQGPAPTWVVRDAGGGDARASAAAVGPSGETWVVGTRYQAMQLGDEVLEEGYGTFLAKLDAAGAVTHLRELPRLDYAVALAATPDGGVVLATQHRGPVDLGHGVVAPSASGAFDESGYADGLIAKLDASAKAVWARSFGGPQHDDAHAVAVAADGRLAVGGVVQQTVRFGDLQLAAPAAAPNDEVVDPIVFVLDANGGLISHTRFVASPPEPDGGYSYYSRSNSVADVGFAADGVVVLGSFEGSLAAGEGELAAASDRDLFLAHVTGSGEVARAGRFAGTGDEGTGRLLVEPDASAWVSFTATGDVRLDAFDAVAGKGTGYHQSIVVRVDAD